MHIQSIILQHLRCHDVARWDCTPGVNVLLGPNGSGKTSFLEAIYLSVFGHSFRQARAPDLVQWGYDAFCIDTHWLRYGPLHIHMVGKNKKNTMCLQGKNIDSRKELLDSFPIVLDSPHAARLVDATSNERRRWLDALLLQCIPNVKHHYRCYLRALMQRQRALRQSLYHDELDVWELQLAKHGQPMMAARNQLINTLNAYLNNESLCQTYPLQLAINQCIPNEIEWLETLKMARIDDKRLGRVKYGPHADQLSILFANKEAKLAGSHGQQRVMAVILRLAESYVLKNYRGQESVLLLDDCLESLDTHHQYMLLRRLSQYAGQVFVTAPEGVDIPNDLSLQTYTIGKLGNDTKVSSIMERAA